MDSTKIGLFGCGVLLAGLFAPVFTLPIIGPTHFIGTNYEFVSLGLVALSSFGIYACAKDEVEHLIWVGLAALMILLASFASAQFRHLHAKSELEQKLAGNPYAAETLDNFSAPPLEWGWIVLAAGVGLIIYAAVSKRKGEPSDDPTGIVDERSKIYKVSSAVPVAIALAIIGIGHFNSLGSSAGNAMADMVGDVVARDANEAAATAEANATEGEKRDYITQNLEIYQLQTRYMDSLLDGRIPGVTFKLRNNGDRTLDRVEVTVQFLNSEGQPIAEEVYYPVLTGGFDSDPPLRPGYIWQNERGRFYSAKSVPSEWQSGQAKAFVSDIDFAEEE